MDGKPRKLRTVQPVIHELEALLQEVAEWRKAKISLRSFIGSEPDGFCSACKRDTSTLVLPEKICGLCWVKRTLPAKDDAHNIDSGTF